MSTKTITIAEEAYERLRAERVRIRAFQRLLSRNSPQNESFWRYWMRLVEMMLWQTELRLHPERCVNPK
jgi:predicted CopG family antitoxin